MQSRAGSERDVVGAVMDAGRRLVPMRLPAVRELVRALTPFSWKQGATYRRVRRLVRDADRWDEEQAAAYQLRQLRAVLAAAMRAPAHQRRFAQAGVDPSDLRSLADIQRFPVMTKDELRAAPGEFLVDWMAAEGAVRVPMTTGGTTGRPVAFSHAADVQEVFTAFCDGLWSRIGYAPGRRALEVTASFPGDLHLNAQRQVLYLSIASLGGARFEETANRLQRFQPEFLIAFPSTATQLARQLGSAGVSLGLRGVILGSEVLYPWQRTALAEFFRCPVLSWYGMAEYAAFAAGCVHGPRYHFMPAAGYVELLGEDGRPVSVGDEGEIVVTGFHATATPFIRYRTGDRAVLAPSQCPDCGRRGPSVAAIDGRVQDAIVGTSGQRIPLTALNVHDETYAGVDGVQVHQREPGRVLVSLCPGPGFTPERADIVRRAIEDRLGPAVVVEVRLVRELARTPRGKQPFLVQEVPLRGALEIAVIREGVRP